MASSKVTRLHPNGINGEALTTCHYVNTDNVTYGSAHEKGQTLLLSADERFCVGVWECTPCCEEIPAWPGDEFCQVLEGSVAISCEGQTQVFNAGDSFTLRKGAAVTWQMTSHFKKYFVLYS